MISIENAFNTNCCIAHTHFFTFWLWGTSGPYQNICRSLIVATLSSENTTTVKPVPHLLNVNVMYRLYKVGAMKSMVGDLGLNSIVAVYACSLNFDTPIRNRYRTSFLPTCPLTTVRSRFSAD